MAQPSQASASGLFLCVCVRARPAAVQLISLSDKLSIINAVEHGEKHADFTRSTGLSKQAVCSTFKNKAAAEKHDSGEIEEQRFRIREVAHP